MVFPIRDQYSTNLSEEGEVWVEQVFVSTMY